MTVKNGIKVSLAIWAAATCMLSVSCRGKGAGPESPATQPTTADKEPAPPANAEEGEEQEQDTGANAAVEPKIVRLLIRGEQAKKMATFLNADLAAKPGGVIEGKNCSCVNSKDNVTTCGQLIAAGGVGHGLEEFGFDGRPGMTELEVLAKVVEVATEKNDGKLMLRVRVSGPEAASIAQFLDPALAAKAPSVITGKNHSCVLNGAGEATCGFILGPDGSAYPLEQFGYR